MNSFWQKLKKEPTHKKRMNKTYTHLIAIGLFLLLTSTFAQAQLFENNELYPKVVTIKGKYFNGSGGGAYGSMEYIDSIGRVVKKETYHKQKLLSRRLIQYDKHNNKTVDIQTYDINKPERVDTFKYNYTYENNRIIYQSSQLSRNDSTLIKLIKNQGDTLLKYQEKAFYYRPKTKKTDVYETIYTLIFQKGRLIRKEVFYKKLNSTEIKKYRYDDQGRLKRRQIERIPTLEVEPVYNAGPGSDDESYEYKLDSEGRIKKYYKIVNGKKYKIAAYKYNEK